MSQSGLAPGRQAVGRPLRGLCRKGLSLGPRPADWLPAKADGLTPSTMTLIAKYVARHRLREPPLLDSIAAFLLRRIDQLDSKVRGEKLSHACGTERGRVSARAS